MATASNSNSSFFAEMHDMSTSTELASPEQDRAGKPGARRTQEQRRSDAEARLIQAARQIVARKGWVGMTLSEVGIAAGYSRGLVTHHFGSKPELLRALAVHIGQNFMTSFRESPVRREGLHAVLEFILAYMGRSGDEWTNTRALLILMAEGMTDESDTGANLTVYNQGAIEFISQHFREGVERKEIRDDIEPVAAAVALLGTVRGIMLQKLLKSSAIDLASVTREVMAMTIRAYAQRPQTWLAQYVRPSAG